MGTEKCTYHLGQAVEILSGDAWCKGYTFDCTATLVGEEGLLPVAMVLQDETELVAAPLNRVRPASRRYSMVMWCERDSGRRMALQRGQSPREGGTWDTEGKPFDVEVGA